MHLIGGGPGRLEEQLREALVPVAQRLAVHVEYIAKLHPAVGAHGPDEQQIGRELAVPNGHRRRRADVLHVPFLRNDAGQLSLEFGDVRTGLREYGLERRLLRRGGDCAQDGERGAAGRSERSHCLTMGASFSSTDTMNWRKFEYVAMPSTRLPP